MGEMADYVLSGPLGWEDFQNIDRTRECGYCGRAGLHWEKWGDSGWRLFTRDGKVHTCQAYREANKC